MPKPVPVASLCAPTESAWPPPTCATAMTTVGTAATSLSAPPLWPAGRTISAAIPQSVCRSCGAATETPTALTVPTRGQSAVAATGHRTCSTDGPTAPLASFGAPTVNVWGWRGNVMATQTARTNLMSLTVVSVPVLQEITLKGKSSKKKNFGSRIYPSMSTSLFIYLKVFSYSACPRASWGFGATDGFSPQTELFPTSSRLISAYCCTFDAVYRFMAA